jgi:hypothetical protein
MSRIITNPETFQITAQNVNDLVNSYEELLNYAATIERALVLEKTKRIYESENPRRGTWIRVAKEIRAEARKQLRQEVGYKGLSEIIK